MVLNGLWRQPGGHHTHRRSHRRRCTMTSRMLLFQYRPSIASQWYKWIEHLPVWQSMTEQQTAEMVCV